MAFFSLFLQADGSGGGGGRKNRRGLTTMSLNESRGSAGGGDRGSTGGVSTYMEFLGLVVSTFTWQSKRNEKKNPHIYYLYKSST